MLIAETRSYDARLVDRSLVRGRDGSSAFKLYRLDIVGRDHPERYEWSRSGLDPAELSSRVEKAEGIGFVTAFPHITKIFRFDPGAETVLLVRGYRTADFQDLDLGRPEGFGEFACLAEALIAADEYRLWAKARDVEGYSRRFSGLGSGAAIRDHGKLRRYWSGP